MLHDRIVAALSEGQSLRSALAKGVRETVSVANSRLRHGEDLHDVLADEDLLTIPSIISYVRGPQPPRTLNEEYSIGSAVQIVLPGDDLDGIPSARCMEARLPQGRPPTRDELRRAWEACRE
jgi:hypothetical protein